MMLVDHPTRGRLAEIIVSRGMAAADRGSGYLVAPGWVLTCWHVVDGANRIGVWLGAPEVLDPDEGIGVHPGAVASFPRADLALVPVGSAVEPVEPVLWGRVDRDASTPVPVVAAGFPRFKLRPTRDRPGTSLREVHYATGHVQAASNRKTGTLEMSVTATIPEDDPEPARHSPWEGMSGAPVWAVNRVVGIVGQHHPGEGRGTVTVLTIEDLLRDAEADEIVSWRDALPSAPAAPDALALATTPTERQLTVRRAHAAAARVAPDVLVARERQLARLAAFSTSDERWRWATGEAFAGKSALLAWFALHPPDQVDVAACFLRRVRAGENTFEYALDTLSRQLAVLADQSGYQPASYPSERLDDFLDLLAHAAAACRERSRRLLLLVDGLDEYQAAAPGLGLDAWLPDATTLPEGAQLLVASRQGTLLPVPDSHPLWASVDIIPPSEAAKDLQEQATRELEAAVSEAAGELTLPILTCLAAAETGLTATEVTELLRRRGRDPDVSEVRQPLDTSFHRTLVPQADQDHPDDVVYSFAHVTLLSAAMQRVSADLATYHSLLDRWADEYAELGWPSDTPRYLHLPYTTQLLRRARQAESGTESRKLVDQACRIVSDRHRHGRVLARSGNPGLADQEITDTQHALLGARQRSGLEPDEILYRLAVLALRRRPLIGQPAQIAADVAGVWALCGRPDAAVTLAEHVHDRRLRSGALVHVTKMLALRDPRRALDTAEVIEDDGTRDDALFEVARGFAAVGNLEGAIDAAECIHQADDRASALAQVAEALARNGRTADALEVAARVDQPGHQPQALVLVAEACTDRGDLNGAIAAAARMRNTELQGRALVRIAGRAVNDQCTERVVETTAIAEPPHFAARALTEIARALRSAGSPEAAITTAQKALAAASRIDVAIGGARALLAVTQVLGDTDPASVLGAAELALEAAHHFDDPQERACAYICVARALAGAAEAERAVDLTRLVDQPHLHAKALAEVALALARAQCADAAIDAAGRIEDRYARASAFTDCARALAAAGLSHEAFAAADHAGVSATGIIGADHRAQALLDLAEVLNTHIGTEQALETADDIDTPHLRAQAMIAIARALAAGGRGEEALAAADRALGAIDGVGRSLLRARALADLAQAYAGAGDTDQASAAASRIGDRQLRAAALTDVAVTLAMAARHPDAVQTAGRIADLDRREQAIASVAEALAAAGRTPEALDAASRIIDRRVRAHALTGVGQALASRGDADGVRSAARMMPDAGDRARALSGAARIMVSAGWIDDALALAHDAHPVATGLDHPESRSAELTRVAQAFLAVGDTASTVLVADTIADPDDRARVLAEVAQVLSTTGQASSALEAAGRIEKAPLRARALMAVARRLVSTGDIGLALEAADRALDAADRIADVVHQQRLLNALTLALAAAGADTELVHQTLRRIDDPGHMARALTAVRQALDVGTGRALDTAGTIDEDAHRAATLAAVAHTLAGVGRLDEARMAADVALAASRELHDPDARARALTAVADVFAHAGHRDQALGIAAEVDDLAGRARALTTVASALAVTGKGKAVGTARQAEDAVADLGDGDDQVPLLSDLALAFARAGDSAQALDVADRIGDMNDRTSTMIGVARALCAAGTQGPALDVADIVVRAALEIEHPYHQARVLAELAGVFAAVGTESRASATADLADAAAGRVDDPYLRAQALTNTAAAFAEAGDATRALDVAGGIEEPSLRSVALTRVGHTLASVGEFDGALDAITLVDDPDDAARELAELARTLVTCGDRDRALIASGQAAITARRIEQSGERARALATVARAFWFAGETGQSEAMASGALEAARLVDEPSVRTHVLTDIAATLAAAGSIAKSLEVADGIGDPSDRTAVFTAIAETMAGTRWEEPSGPDDAQDDLLLRQLTEQILLAPDVAGALRVLPGATLGRLVVDGELC